MLARDEVHDPAEHNGRSDEEYEAIDAVADHALRRFALGDAEHGRSEQREEKDRSEVGGAEHLELPPGADVVSVDGGDDVEEAGDDDEPRAPVSDSELHRVSAEA